MKGNKNKFNPVRGTLFRVFCPVDLCGNVVEQNRTDIGAIPPEKGSTM